MFNHQCLCLFLHIYIYIYIYILYNLYWVLLFISFKLKNYCWFVVCSFHLKIWSFGYLQGNRSQGDRSGERTGLVTKSSSEMRIFGNKNFSHSFQRYPCQRNYMNAASTSVCKAAILHLVKVFVGTDIYIYIYIIFRKWRLTSNVVSAFNWSGVHIYIYIYI